MTKEQFDDLYLGKVVHCDTEEKAKALLKLAKSFGYKWESGSDLEKINYWGNHKENTCYRFIESFVLYSPKRYYRELGCTIVEFELEKETTKENDTKFKVGDKVRVRKDLKNENCYGGIFFNKQMENARGKVFTIGSIQRENSYTLSDFVVPYYLWSDKMLEPVETFKVGDKVIAKGQSMVIVEIITCKDGETRYKTQQGYTWSANELTLEETFKVGDVVYDEKGRECVIKTIAYRVEYTTTHQGYREANEIAHKKPLTKITKEQLAEMGYEVE